MFFQTIDSLKTTRISRSNGRGGVCTSWLGFRLVEVGIG